MCGEIYAMILQDFFYQSKKRTWRIGVILLSEYHASSIRLRRVILRTIALCTQ